MSVFTYILISTIIFILVIYVLVAMLLGVKSKLLPSGPVKILINDEKEIEVSSGSTLLTTLGDNETAKSLVSSKAGMYKWATIIEPKPS